MNGRQGVSPPLLLDHANERVKLGDRPLRLTPKAFGVLSYLMKHAGRLVTKDELLANVWSQTVVTEASLATCVREVRRALGDAPAKPLYIETVHRRGYRYIGPSVRTERPVSTRLVVGRARELEVLHQAWHAIERGGRRIIFVTGEAGIGKTTLVERFCAQLAGHTTARIARGQCIEQYGACESYLPWFDVLNQLCRDYGRNRILSRLRRCAPMWLAQLPWLMDAPERARLQSETAGVTPERMMRELAELLEALCVDGPLILLIEDVHWSDASSIALLRYLARCRSPQRLLILATYRQQEATSPAITTLQQELLLCGDAEELAVDLLTKGAVAEYLQSRLPAAPDGLAARLHRRTDGNPLFMVNVVDYLLAQDAQWQCWYWLALHEACDTAMPASLYAMIERQLERLALLEQRVIEAASLVGASFSAAAVAAALQEPVELVEERLELLARRGLFVRFAAQQSWPDGSQSNGYDFIHALYQNALYARVGAARKGRMHLLLAERLESAYRGQVDGAATALAVHFQLGWDARRAVYYFALAGEAAIRRSAYPEAISLLNQGMALLATLPKAVERDASEVQLRVALGVCYANTLGYAAPEVGETFGRAHSLCLHVREGAQHIRVLRGVWFFAEQRGELQKALSVAAKIAQIADGEPDVFARIEGQRILATTYFHLGELACSLDSSQRAAAHRDLERNGSYAIAYGQDPVMCCLAWQSWTQWYLGYPDCALTSANRSIEWARQVDHPFSLAYALNFAARLHLCRRDSDSAAACARESVRLAREHGLAAMLAMGQILHGCSVSLLGRSNGAVAELEEGVARWKATGARLMTPYWMYLLATALDRSGRVTQAAGVLDEAFAAATHTGEQWFKCEMHILKAGLITRACTAAGRSDQRLQARRHLHRALRAATDLQSPPLRLRAANALTELTQL